MEKDLISEILRYELIFYFKKQFTINFTEFYDHRHKNVKLSKTMKEYSINKLKGLEGLIIRIVSGLMIVGDNTIPLFPKYYGSDYDTYLLDELEHECGLYKEDAIELYKNTVENMNMICDKFIDLSHKDYGHGELKCKKIEDMLQIAYYNDKLAETLKTVRTTIKSYNVYNYNVYNNENDFVPKIKIYTSILTKLQKSYLSEGFQKQYFFERLYCMILRYETYTGNTEGTQGTISPKVFNYLKQKFMIDTECFASPLNYYHENKYFSAFYDTDKYFGSKGSFFDHTFENGGFYEVNPPFLLWTMNECVSKITTLLETLDNILFFVVLPRWEDADAYKLLLASPYLRGYGILNNKDHIYYQGLTHRNSAYWSANVDSAWFLLSKQSFLTINSNEIEEVFRK